jgi:hypothetical protein
VSPRYALTCLFVEMPKSAYAAHQPTTPVACVIAPITSDTMLIVAGHDTHATPVSVPRSMLKGQLPYHRPVRGNSPRALRGMDGVPYVKKLQ